MVTVLTKDLIKEVSTSTELLLNADKVLNEEDKKSTIQSFNENSLQVEERAAKTKSLLQDAKHTGYLENTNSVALKKGFEAFEAKFSS